MGKCPYCSNELHLEDFFEVKKKKETRKGKIRVKVENFKGEIVEPLKNTWSNIKMWVCPYCDVILGFSEYAWN